MICSESGHRGSYLSILPNVLNASVAEFNFKSVIDKLGDVMYTYPFSLPPFYIAVIRCLGVLEGVALQASMATPARTPPPHPPARTPRCQSPSPQPTTRHPPVTAPA